MTGRDGREGKERKGKGRMTVGMVGLVAAEEDMGRKDPSPSFLRASAHALKMTGWGASLCLETGVFRGR